IGAAAQPIAGKPAPTSTPQFSTIVEYLWVTPWFLARASGLPGARHGSFSACEIEPSAQVQTHYHPSSLRAALGLIGAEDVVANAWWPSSPNPSKQIATFLSQHCVQNLFL